ncbi:MAG TPA: helix-hairpin-helix domain-containing protein [Candidatus Deferrimicrobiaceae bacterium]|nr:helix-hairpin-helix domain-containing protein [Candidatus Deferrimicrobiaceae bacterium]
MLERWCPRTVVVLAGVLLTVASGSVPRAAPALAPSTRDAAGVTKVNLNTATQQELQTLRGIGPATAKRIIRNRPYAATAELSRAEVAGPIIDLISPRVTVGPAPAQATGR